MAFTALERMLSTERFQQRAGAVGHAIPALIERASREADGPFLVTNMRGTFLPTRLASSGVVRFGFSEVPLEEDDLILAELHKVVSRLSDGEGWSNRCTSVQEAVARIRGTTLEPKTIVIPPSMLDTLGLDLGEEAARARMARQGYVTKIDEMQVLLANLPDGQALVAAAPSVLGVYTRVGNHLGILLQRVDRALVVVS